MMLHQAMKDLGLLKWAVAGWLALLVAIQVAVLYTASLTDPGRDVRSVDTLLTVLRSAATGVFLVLAALVVQNDSPSSATAFWLTRPISGRAMLGSKLLFACSILVALPLALDFLAVVSVGIGPGAYPCYRLLLAQLAWLLPLMAVAAVTSRFSQFFGVVLFEIVAFYAFGALLSAMTDITFAPPAVAVFASIAAAYGCLVVAYQYLARRRTAGIVMIAAAPVLIAGLTSAWPRRDVDADTIPAPARITFAFDRTTMTMRDLGNAVVVQASLDAIDIPPGTETYPQLRSAWLEADGRRISTRAAMSVAPRGPDAARRAALGAFGDALDKTVVLNPSLGTQPSVALTIEKRDFEQVAEVPCVLRADIDVTALVRRVSDVVPLRVRQAYAAPALRGTIMTIDASAGRATIGVREAAIPWFNAPFSSHAYLVRNQAAGESVLPSAARSGPGFGGGWIPLPVAQDIAVTWSPLHLDLSASRVGREAPRSWLDQASLVVVTRTLAGRFTAHAEIRDLHLSRIAPAAGR